MARAERGERLGLIAPGEPRPLPRAFYDRDTAEVARALLGCLLIRETGAGRVVTRVVETEAYVGPHDLACHASKGVTPRTEVLYGPPGIAYVYMIYGMYHCLNAVTERAGHGAAVLIRGVEPLAGLAPEMRTDGPGKLTRALAIDRALNRHDLTRQGALWFAPPAEPPSEAVAAGPRVGVDYAGAWATEPLRFWLAGNRFVSRGPKPT